MTVGLFKAASVGTSLNMNALDSALQEFAASGGNDLYHSVLTLVGTPQKAFRKPNYAFYPLTWVILSDSKVGREARPRRSRRGKGAKKYLSLTPDQEERS